MKSTTASEMRRVRTNASPTTFSRYDGWKSESSEAAVRLVEEREEGR